MWDVRAITEEDADMFRARLARGFGRDLPEDEGRGAERFRATFELPRTLAAFDGGDMIGTAAAFSLGVTVPGGSTVPMGGTTVISVQPTHRRRGVMRALMDRHLEDVAEHDEPLAGLWASEGSIYGRFGFGPATYRLQMAMSGPGIQFRPEVDGGSVRLVDGDEAEKTVISLFERLQGGVAGVLTRSDAWWSHRVFADIEEWREGRSALRFAIHEQGGEPSGYVMYRQKAKWDDFVAQGEVSVDELVALDRGAHVGLWRFLTNVDLFPEVRAWNLPVDDPLPMVVTEHRRVRRTIADALWVRVMDVEAAMTSRAYEEDGDVTFEIVDGARPDTSGTYRLEVRDGVGECRSVSSPAQVTLQSDVLGHLYLGGGNALAMASAGRVTGDPDSVVELHRLMRTVAAPWCPEVF